MSTRPPWLGPLLAATAALGFASGTTIAVIAYEAGATPLSVVTTRITFTLLVVFVLIRATRGTLRLAPRDRAAALATGLVLGLQSYTYYEAVGLLPVAIAILLLYLYPLLVGVLSHATGHERMRPILGVSMVVALIGLYFALDVDGSLLNPTGIALGCVAAASLAIVVVASASLVRRAGSSLPVTLHMNLAASVMVAVISAGLGEFPLPATHEGWVAFALVPVFYATGFICFIMAIGTIGPVRASLIMNLEPVIAIVIGFILLDQLLKPLQLLGVFLVVGAVVAARWHPAPAAPPTAD